MPAFGLLVIILGIWVLINTINGNLLDIVEGKATFNFTSSPSQSDNVVNPRGSQAQQSKQSTGSTLTSDFGAGR